MKHYAYKTAGVCSRMIDLDIDGDTVVKVTFTGGCPGNTQGVDEKPDNASPAIEYSPALTICTFSPGKVSCTSKVPGSVDS